MGNYFNADTKLVLVIALMVTASLHFLRSASSRTSGNGIVGAYLKLCDACDTILHFFCILTIFAFGYSYGLMEAVKLLVVCLVMPLIGYVFALVMGTNNWNRTASVVALPIGIVCAFYIFPRLSWFGFF